MLEYQELMPDAELFARVWKRVMPDERLSHIVVHTPEEQTAQRNLTSPTAESPKPVVPDERELLAEVLEQMESVRRGVEEILRRDPGAWPLGESVRKSMPQLRAAWLILTGERRKGKNIRQTATGSMETLLREQYRRELCFSERCRQLEELLGGTDVSEIMAEQRQESGRRRRMLRHMLARRT